MNITHKTTTVMTPFRALWRWLMSEPVLHQTKPDAAYTTVKHGSNQQHETSLPAPTCSSPSALRKPVRVLQVLDAGQTPQHVGRLRISGRMADVCAELDRLAARELLIH